MKTAHKPSILVVDDEAIVRLSLRDWFSDEGCDVDVAENGAEALRAAAARPHDIALIDIKMPGMDGLELQARLAEKTPDLTVIMMTAYASVETAVGALKAGAYDYIVKPFDPDELTHLVKRASEHRALRAENVMLKQRLAATSGPAPIIGTSPATRRVLQLVDTVAPADTTVLVLGESGTGKELVARAIHMASPDATAPFVAVNCAALVETLLESEMFGHERGAFTGAVSARKGKVEQAAGGTLFLDEISELSPRLQGKLLRLLEEREYSPVGSSETMCSDARFIAATNVDLAVRVKTGEFREDLYYRLHVVNIGLPPLRDRRGDIGPLVEHLLKRINREVRKGIRRVSSEVMDALVGHDWPGNVRQLENTLLKAVVMAQGDTLTLTDLPAELSGGPANGTGAAAGNWQAEQSSHVSLKDLERRHIEEVLSSTGWHKGQACEILGISRPRLERRLREFSITQPG